MQMTNQTKTPQDLLLYTILIFGIGWLIFTYQVLLGPLIIACLIAYLLYPGVTWISNRTRVDRHLIVPIVYLTFITIMIVVIIFVAPAIISQFFSLTDQLVRLPDILETTQKNLEEFLGFSVPFDTYINEFQTDMGQLFKPERIFRIIQGASTNIVWVLITFIASFYLLRDWERLREWSFGLTPNHLEPDLRRLHHEIKGVWHTYLRGQLLIMTILGILSGLGAAIIGIPGALFLGFLAGSLALIPSLGPATVTAIAAIVAWTQGSHYWEISNITATLTIVIIFLAIQFIEGFWITPQIMGRRLNLHPGLMLIAVVGTLFTLGALMALIIIPLIGSLDLIFRYVRRKQAGLNPWAVEDLPLETNVTELYQDIKDFPNVTTEINKIV